MPQNTFILLDQLTLVDVNSDQRKINKNESFPKKMKVFSFTSRLIKSSNFTISYTPRHNQAHNLPFKNPEIKFK